MVTGSWFGELTRRAGLELNAGAHLSLQTDRATDGPLDPTSELSSRDPFGGFMVLPLDFRFDANTFPVNAQLVQDFRTGGRLTPYDLNNSAQYQLVSQWRTNAYAVETPFWESGGPMGRITLSQEDHVLGKLVLDGRIGGGQHVRLGGEVVNYDINYYSSNLRSLALSDAYLESPHRLALYGDYDITLGQVTLRAGLRYDHFTSGAALLSCGYPRASEPVSAPFHDAGLQSRNSDGASRGMQHHPEAASDVLRGHVCRTHPGCRTFAGESTVRRDSGSKPSTHLSRLGDLRAEMPDFTPSYQEVNTDISFTSPSQVYGSNLDFEPAVLGEIGGRLLLDAKTAVDAALWTRRDDGALEVRSDTAFDPRNLSPTLLTIFANAPERTASGIDLIATRLLGVHGRAWVSYSYVHTDVFSAPSSEARPHTVAGALEYQSGSGSRLLGGLFRQVGVYTDARFASGTPYTPCSGLFVDAGTLSSESCFAPAAHLNSANLPTLKLVDLRISKEINVAGTTITAFADIRNLFNTENVSQVFSQTGTTTNPLDHASNLFGDLQAYAAEAAANGVLQADSTIDLRFAGMGASGCGTWVNQAGASATPNCIYLIRAERRFGNGDPLFTVAEQTRAPDAFYMIGKGLQYFTAPGRLVRLGLQVGF